MKRNFLYQITAASRTPWLGGYRPEIPVFSVLCPQFVETPPRNKIPGYATVLGWAFTLVILPVERGFRSVQSRIKQFLLYGGRQLSIRPSGLYCERDAVCDRLSALLYLVFALRRTGPKFETFKPCKDGTWSVFGRVRKIAKSDYHLRNVDVCPCAWNISDSRWTGFHEIWYLNIFRMSIEKV